MLKLWVGKTKSSVKEIAGVAIGAGLKEIKKKPVAEAIKLYLKNITSKKCPKNKKSELSYFIILEKFCVDNKIKTIDELKIEHVESLQTTFLKRMKPNSLNRRFSVYRHFLNKCDDWGYITQNPFLKVKRQKIVKVHFNPWTEEQFNAFLKRTSGTHNRIFQFLWLTGCRPMELKNLKWSDIDYDEKCIYFECYKNKDGKRRFPLTDPVSKLLHQMKAETQFIFSVNKKQVENDNLYQYAKTRLKTLGFKNLTVYGLRHSFACGLNSADVNAFNIKELLGHSDIRTTLNYIHVDEANLQAALKKAKR